MYFCPYSILVIHVTKRRYLVFETFQQKTKYHHAASLYF